MVKKLTTLLSFTLALLIFGAFVSQASANSYFKYDSNRHHSDRDFSYSEERKNEYRHEISRVRNDLRFEFDRLRDDFRDNRHNDFLKIRDFEQFFRFFDLRHTNNFRHEGHFRNQDVYRDKEHHKDDQNVAEFYTTLRGENEVPGPGDPDGTGTAVLTVNPEKSELCVKLKVAGIARATAAHIHEGDEGVAGPVVVTLPTPDESGFASDCGSVDSNLLQQIKNNPAHYYVNVHNDEYPDGAVRGQVSG